MSSATPSAEFRITYDAALVEESVLLAERRLSVAEAATFRAERDRIYDVDEPDEREARFEELHGRFFLQLGLDRPLHEVLAERPELLLRTRRCRVLPAVSRQEEMAGRTRQPRVRSRSSDPSARTSCSGRSSPSWRKKRPCRSSKRASRSSRSSTS